MMSNAVLFGSDLMVLFTEVEVKRAIERLYQRGNKAWTRSDGPLN